MAVFDILARLKIEKGDTSGVDSVASQLVDIEKHANIPVVIDTKLAEGGIDTLNEKVSTQVRSINDWKAKLVELRAARDTAEDTGTINSLNSQIAIAAGEIKKLSTASEGGFQTKPVDSFKEHLGDMDTAVHKSEGGLSSLKEKFSEGLGVGTAILGIQSIGSAIEGSFEKFEIQEKAEKGLELAFEDLGDKGKQTVEDLKGFASARQAITEFGDESTLKLLQFGKQFAGISDPAKLKKFAVAVQDYAAATGKDLETASQTLAAKLEAGGKDKTLAVKFVAGDAEGNLDKFLDAADKKIGGFAEKIAQSPAGAIKQFQNDFGDMEEQIGGALAQVVGPIATSLKPVVIELGGAIGVVGKAIGGVIGFVSENKAAFATLAIGAGILALSMNGAAVGTTALGIAQKAQAISTSIVTGAQTLLNTVMEANPIGLIIGGLALLAAGAIYLYNNVKPVHDAIDSVWSVLKATGSFIGVFVKEYIGGLVTAFGGVGKVLDGIIHLDFNKVKEGAAEVGKGVSDAYGGAALKGVQAFKGSLDESSKALADQGKQGEKTGDSEVDSAARAAAAQKKLAEQAAEVTAAFDSQQKALTDNVAYIEKQITANLENKRQLQDILKTGRDLAGNTLTPQQTAELQKQLEGYDEGNKLLTQTGKNRFANLATMKKEGETAKELIEGKKEEKKKEEDLLALAKQKADSEAKALEVKLRLQRAQEGVAFSSQDELTVQQKFGSVLQQQITDKKLLSNSKYAVRAQLELDQSSIKDLEIKAKIKVEAEKLQKDLETAIVNVSKKEIELGIRPKSDTLSLIQSQRDELQRQFDKISIDPFDPTSRARAFAQLEQLHLQELELDKQENDFKGSQSKELQDLRVSLMDEGLDKELTQLNIKHEQELQFVRDAISAGRELKGEELDREKLLEQKYQKDVLALRAKAAKDAAKSEVDIAKAAKDGLLAIYHSISEERKKLSKEEVDDKEHGFDKERTALEGSLQKGEISQKEYTVELAKLAKERSDFESQQDAELRSKLAVGIDGTLQHAKAAIDEEVADFIAGAVAKELQSILSQEAMTAASVSGSAARQAANVTEQVTQSAATQSTLIGAVASLLAKWIGIAGPPGLALGLASAAILEASFIGIAAGIKAIGFANGGLMGVVGERGPEFVGPAKDMSFMISQLVSNTTLATERAIDRRGGSPGGRQRVDVRLGGQATTRGRDLVHTIEREDLSRQKERLVPA